MDVTQMTPRKYINTIMKALHTLQDAGLLVWEETTDNRTTMQNLSNPAPVTGLVPTVRVKLINIRFPELLTPRLNIMGPDDEIKELYAQVTKPKAQTAAGA
jgi:hypothetical protein